MSTVTAASSNLHTVQTGPSIRHFLFRRLHSLTGIIFGGYIVIHLLINASLLEGAATSGLPTVFQVQVDKIHSLPFLFVVETVFIYLPLLFHAVYGIWITVTGKPNVANYPFGKNWFYVLQRASAIILVFFIAFHIFGMKGLLGSSLAFDPARATDTTIAHMNSSWLVGWVVYPIGIFAGCYHLANGFWTAAITWGLTVSRQAQRRWGLVCVGLFFLTFGSGMTALAAALMRH